MARFQGIPVEEQQAGGRFGGAPIEPEAAEVAPVEAAPIEGTALDTIIEPAMAIGGGLLGSVAGGLAAIPTAAVAGAGAALAFTVSNSRARAGAQRLPDRLR